jgi:hypothetical protein
MTSHATKFYAVVGRLTNNHNSTLVEASASSHLTTRRRCEARKRPQLRT